MLAVNGATMIVYCLCMFSLSYTKNGCVYCLAGLLNAFQFIWLVLMCVYFFSITAVVVVYKVSSIPRLRELISGSRNLPLMTKTL